MKEIQTHLDINHELCGFPIIILDDESRVKLETKPQMSSDSRGLVHGGFIFGAADYSAMLLINTPNVVLGSSSAKFMRPTKVGEVLIFTAKKQEQVGKKIVVNVVAYNEKEEIVFEGLFNCFDLDKHVFD